MWFFGDKRGQDLIDKVRALHSQDMVKDVLTQLYADLSTLDSKASGLLTVDGLFVAILSLYPSLNVIGDAKTRARITVLIDLQLVLAVVSAFLCMLVVRVSWRFYRLIPMNATTEADFEREIDRIANVIDDRTHYYWLAWLLTTFAFIVTLAWWSNWAGAAGAVALLIWTARRG